MQTSTLLSSLREHGDDEYVVHVLHDGLDDDLRARITAGGGGIAELEWIDTTAHDWTSFRTSPGVSPAVLYRLRIADLLPDLDRVIYLDADTMVLSSLRPLWEEDLGGKPIAAVRDIGFPSFAGIIAWRDPRTRTRRAVLQLRRAGHRSRSLARTAMSGPRRSISAPGTTSGSAISAPSTSSA